MNDLTSVVTSTVMSSREIADLTGKRHSDVCRDIRVMLDSIYELKDDADLRHQFIQGVTEDRDNRNYVSLYRLDKDHTLTLLTGYDAKARLRVVKRWQELEATPKYVLPTTYLEALKALVVQAEVNIVLEAKTAALEHQAAIDTPKAKALDRLEGATGSLCITDVAKALKIQPKDLFDRLVGMKWIYRRPGGKFWIGYQDKVQSGYVEHRVTTVTQNNGSERIVEQALITPKGISKLARTHNGSDPSLSCAI